MKTIYYLNPDDIVKPTDEVACSSAGPWRAPQDSVGNRAGDYPSLWFRRHVEVSHQQDERAASVPCVESQDDCKGVVDVASPAGGTTPEGGDTFLDDVMNAIPASQKSQPADGDTFRAGMDRAIEMAEKWRYKNGFTAAQTELVLSLKRERDEHRPKEGNGETLLQELDRVHRELAKTRNEYDALRKEADRIKKNLLTDCESDSIVASCNCCTKTNDPAHHKPGCKYRLIMERDRLKEELDACRKELEEAIKQRNSTHDAAKGLSSEADFIIRELRARLAEAKRQLTESRWIPVSERMPTKEDANRFNQVLVLYENGHDGAFVVNATGFTEAITHWMPIPPLPPKPQEDEAEKAWTESGLTHHKDYFMRGFNAALASRKEKP